MIMSSSATRILVTLLPVHQAVGLIHSLIVSEGGRLLTERRRLRWILKLLIFMNIFYHTLRYTPPIDENYGDGRWLGPPIFQLEICRRSLSLSTV